MSAPRCPGCDARGLPVDWTHSDWTHDERGYRTFDQRFQFAPTEKAMRALAGQPSADYRVIVARPSKETS